MVIITLISLTANPVRGENNRIPSISKIIGNIPNIIPDSPNLIRLFGSGFGSVKVITGADAYFGFKKLVM